eukprot:12827388-Alexandrium_andersonii.AAC.1
MQCASGALALCGATSITRARPGMKDEVNRQTPRRTAAGRNGMGGMGGVGYASGWMLGRRWSGIVEWVAGIGAFSWMGGSCVIGMSS